MSRWLRLIATATVILSLIGLGGMLGLFLYANSGWVPVRTPPWLEGLFGGRPHEIWLPGLFIGGWLASALLATALVLDSPGYLLPDPDPAPVRSVSPVVALSVAGTRLGGGDE